MIEDSQCSSWRAAAVFTVAAHTESIRPPHIMMHHRLFFVFSRLETTAWLLALIGLYWFTSSFFLAKKSLSNYASTCNEAPDLLHNVLHLTLQEIQFLEKQTSSGGKSSSILAPAGQSPRQGCWMNRQVDALMIIVVDALRFDFALYNLPKSIGHRLYQQQQQHHHHHPNATTLSSSRLLQFVADAPTVTMQRIKALTTGGLPTFADISANFGGGTVEEDSWIRMLSSSSSSQYDNNNVNNVNNNVPMWQNRGLSFSSKIGFVGDDTWLDLFGPQTFYQAFPYPSFNTRDLNTVDNGCLHHIPYFLSKLRKRQRQVSSTFKESDLDEKEDDESMLEVVVVHFLGVDHVGHTYGPHNEHMDAKLRQMDTALADILQTLNSDDSSCRAVFIFGDHGMTPDGNHGGGTEEEINAALFVHSSPACQRQQQQHERHRHEDGNEHEFTSSAMSNSDGGGGGDRDSRDNDVKVGRDLLGLETMDRTSDLVPTSSTIHQEVFAAIRQIDIVPTISMLLGLPIPFANLGSVVPSILPISRHSMRQSAAALALNAAQVWRYLTIYSATASTLPNLHVLEQDLQLAVSMYKQALAADNDNVNNHVNEENSNKKLDDDVYLQAATLFKVFLHKALDLGQRVWTRFDLVGMTGGVVILACGLVLFALPLLQSVFFKSTSSSAFAVDAINMPLMTMIPRSQYAEIFPALVFMLFQCGVLTFGNSYILEEERSTNYCLSILSMAVAIRLYTSTAPTTTTATTMDHHAGNGKNAALLWLGMLLMPMASRLSELAVSGHGMDPSIHVHFVHHAGIFLSSLAWLTAVRVFVVYRYQQQQRQTTTQSMLTSSSLLSHAIVDCLTLLALAYSWWEKRHHRNGYLPCRVALVLLFIGIPLSIVQALVVRIQRCRRRSRTAAGMQQPQHSPKTDKNDNATAVHQEQQQQAVENMNEMLTILSKVLIAIMAVTGPSTAATMVLYTLQVIILFHLCSFSISSSPTSTSTSSDGAISPVVLAALWKLVTRHAFFATNHACAFNRLQYSAAFVATAEFYFGLGGISLFLNTFGWEVVGLGFCWVFGLVQQQQQQQERSPGSKHHSSKTSSSSSSSSVLWKAYGLYQLFEALASCISVSVLRRHLMVWDIYAPHFLFVAIFTVLTGLVHLLVIGLAMMST